MEKVIRHLPEEYPKQQGLTCGETNLKNILSAFRIPYRRSERVPLRVKLLGYSMIKDISERFEAHNLVAPILWANRLTEQEQLEIIKGHIDLDQPVLVAIGSGYLRRGVYSPLARLFIGHYITIYGYSDRDNLFFVYDSSLEGPYPDQIPAGNETRKYTDFIRDWKGPIYYNLIRLKNVYMPIRKRKANHGSG